MKIEDNETKTLWLQLGVSLKVNIKQLVQINYKKGGAFYILLLVPL